MNHFAFAGPPLAAQFRKYLLERAKTPIMERSPMADFYFGMLTKDLESSAAARGYAVALLNSAKTHTEQTVTRLLEDRGCSSDELLIARTKIERVEDDHCSLPHHRREGSTWGKTLESLLVRWQLDGIITLHLTAEHLGFAEPFTTFLDDVFAGGSEGGGDGEGDRRRAPQPAPLSYEKRTSGGVATDIAVGVHVLGVFVDYAVQTEKRDDDSWETRDGGEAAHEFFINTEAKSKALPYAEAWVAEHCFEIISCPGHDELADVMAIWLPKLRTGWFVDQNRALVQLPAGYDHDATSRAPAEFEGPQSWRGRGTSSQLAVFVASVLNTLGALVHIGVTGAIEVRNPGNVLCVGAVGEVTTKLETATRAGLDYVLAPIDGSAEWEKGVLPLPAYCVDTCAEALEVVLRIESGVGGVEAWRAPHQSSGRGWTVRL